MVKNRQPLLDQSRVLTGLFSGRSPSATRRLYEPMHVHAVKGDAECKYWLQPDRFDIVEDFEYNCTPRLRREVRQIIFRHFDQIVVAWREHFGGDRAK